MFSIDRKLLALRTKLFVKKNNFERITTSFSEAKKIGIVFCVEDKVKHASIDHFVHKLQKEGKTVKALCYLPKGKENYEFRFDFFARADLSFWGNFTSPLIEEFLQEDYDYLFSIDHKSHFLVDNIIARSKAKCRIGLYQEEHNQWLEMMVRVQEFKNIDKAIDQMYHYTMELQK